MLAMFSAAQERLSQSGSPLRDILHRLGCPHLPDINENSSIIKSRSALLHEMACTKAGSVSTPEIWNASSTNYSDEASSYAHLHTNDLGHSHPVPPNLNWSSCFD